MNGFAIIVGLSLGISLAVYFYVEKLEVEKLEREKARKKLEEIYRR